MAILGVDDFKSKLRGGGARPTLFKANITFPIYAGGDVELTSFLCKAASLPASTTSFIPVGFRGRQLKVAGDRTFDPWTIVVINDTDMSIRNAFERWMNGINAHQSNTGLTNPVDYMTDMTIDQLDKDESIIKRYNLRACFPTNLSEIALSYDTTDTIEEFSVEFQMQYWESQTTS
jgi:hypothetical protein